MVERAGNWRTLWRANRGDDRSCKGRCTPADFGLIAMLLVFTTVAAILVDSGFGTALVQQQRTGDDDETDGLLGWRGYKHFLPRRSTVVKCLSYRFILCTTGTGALSAIDGMRSAIECFGSCARCVAYTAPKLPLTGQCGNLRIVMLARLRSCWHGGVSGSGALLGNPLFPLGCAQRCCGYFTLASAWIIST